ncbi:hypothetical protein AK812_SmicGene31058 [Symbiodinium microadriaticum]|uniref:Uncharacterized protein n=1 Tax=Symbiodinium microadriaticum TaxID=2951 RepID=A0A1Q9CXP2_SYMMI|nr:hypothetical protein AK812_SmicGene31058 [Symbiodinium microadriaticum]
MEPDVPPGLESSESQVGLDVSVLHELLRRQSELISTAGEENMTKLQREWEESLDRVEAKDKLQHWFDDRHWWETESAIEVDLVQTKRKKVRGRRNKAAVGNDTKHEQQVLMDAFDDVCVAHPRTWMWQWTIAWLAVTAPCWNLVNMIGLAMLICLTTRCSSTDKGVLVEGQTVVHTDEGEQEVGDIFMGHAPMVVLWLALRLQQQGVEIIQRQAQWRSGLPRDGPENTGSGDLH